MEAWKTDENHTNYSVQTIPSLLLVLCELRKVDTYRFVNRLENFSHRRMRAWKLSVVTFPEFCQAGWELTLIFHPLELSQKHSQRYIQL